MRGIVSTAKALLIVSCCFCVFLSISGLISRESYGAVGGEKKDLCNLIPYGKLTTALESSAGYRRTGDELGRFLARLVETFLDAYEKERRHVKSSGGRLGTAYEQNPIKMFPGGTCLSDLTIAYLPKLGVVEIVRAAPNANRPIETPYFKQNPSANPDDAFFATYSFSARFSDEKDDFKLLEACASRDGINFVVSNPRKSTVCLHGRGRN